MLLYFGNPDHASDATLDRHFDEIGDLLSSGGTPGIRADGYASRPGLTSTGGDSFVSIYPRFPGIHPAFPYFRQGGRWLFESYPASPVPLHMALNALGEIQVCSALEPDGTISIYRGAVADLLRASNTVLPLDTFHRIGFGGHVSRTSGEAFVQLNRTVINRAPIGNTAASDVIPWSGSAWGLPADCALSHYYVGDSYGHQPDLIPDLLVKYQRPLTVTDVAEWIANVSPYPGAIDDSDSDDDTSYLDAFADGDQFLAGVGPLDVSSLTTIYAAQLSAMVRNIVDYGPAFRHLVALSGAIREGDVDYPPEVGLWRLFRHIYYQAADGEALTKARADLTSIGGKMIGS